MKNLDDIFVTVSVRLGSKKVRIAELSGLDSGNVVQLEQRAKDPVEIYINEKLVGHGEVVVVEDLFGIKITNLVSDNS